jgi:hypothetical protein
MRRDFDLDERVLRYLMLRVEGVPEAERELSQAETAEGFSVPPPPPEETTSAERAVFGDLADRPVQEHSRRAQPEAEEAPAEVQAEPAGEPVGATEES